MVLDSQCGHTGSEGHCRTSASPDQGTGKITIKRGTLAKILGAEHRVQWATGLTECGAPVLGTEGWREYWERASPFCPSGLTLSILLPLTAGLSVSLLPMDIPAALCLLAVVLVIVHLRQVPSAGT